MPGVAFSRRFQGLHEKTRGDEERKSLLQNQPVAASHQYQPDSEIGKTIVNV